MKYLKTLSALVLLFCVSSAFTMKSGSGKKVYVAGVSASFSDSLVYFTDIQAVDSVKLDANGMLPERQQYSYQLKTYLEEKVSVPNRTCFIYFSENPSKLQKEIDKVKDKYIKGRKSFIHEVTSDSFKFTKPSEEE